MSNLKSIRTWMHLCHMRKKNMHRLQGLLKIVMLFTMVSRIKTILKESCVHSFHLCFWRSNGVFTGFKLIWICYFKWIFESILPKEILQDIHAFFYSPSNIFENRRILSIYGKMYAQRQMHMCIVFLHILTYVSGHICKFIHA